MQARLFMVALATSTIALSGCADLRSTGAADKGLALPDPGHLTATRPEAPSAPPAKVPPSTFGGAPANVSGVATDMPLSIVVKMAVPSGVPVTFTPEVNSSIAISWQNKPGEDWKKSLANALHPVGLEARFGSDGAITIMPPPQKWEMTLGLQLEVVLRQWCAKAGPDACAGVIWRNSYHYPIEIGGTIEGDFRHAVEMALRGFKTAPHPPKAMMHSNKSLIIYASDDKGG